MNIKVYALWCNAQKQWFTPGRWFGNGNPKIWTVRKNAEACKKDREYEHRIFQHIVKYPIDLRVVELELRTLNNNHTI